MVAEITPLILTFNEAPNIRRSLSQLRWARRILVIDSFSTDETLQIIKTEFPNAVILQRKFETFAKQCNFGLEHIETEWVLSMDADYILSNELVQEIQRLSPPNDVAGYGVKFIYAVYGHHLRATLYPRRTVLYRKKAAQYREDGHAHKVQVEGRIEQLRSSIIHDDRKPIDRWLNEQLRYSRQEAEHLHATPASKLNRADRLRKKMVFAPLAVFIVCLFGKRLILDGLPGWTYVLQRTFSEILLSLRLLDRHLASNPTATISQPTLK